MRPESRAGRAPGKFHPVAEGSLRWRVRKWGRGGARARDFSGVAAACLAADVSAGSRRGGGGEELALQLGWNA